MYAMVCKQFRKEEERFWFCQERCFVMPVSAKQIIPVTEGIRVIWYRFPDRGGGIFYLHFLDLWCKRIAWRSPKPQISDHTRTDLP